MIGVLKQRGKSIHKHIQREQLCEDMDTEGDQPCEDRGRG